MTDSYRNRIKHILFEICNLPEEKITDLNSDNPLTGTTFRLSSIELVYLFFEVECRFGIEIKPELLNDYGFSTLNKIVDVINKTLKANLV